jgi:Predicted nucleotide-binding protein containing TIR-like domain
MSERRGHIFVAWGGNKPLADKVVDEFRKRDWIATTGGDERAAITSVHLGENIRRQITSAVAALILVEDMSQEDSKEGVFRPNLMLEWGFALSVLPNNLIFPSLIGTNRDRLPSDLQGVWAPSYPSYRMEGSREADLEKVSAVASKIVDDVIVSLTSAEVGFATSPYEVMYSWPEVEAMLSSVVQNKRAILSRHLRLLIPNIAIPAVYDAKRSELNKTLVELRRSHSEISEEASLVSAIFDYYENCEKAKLNENQLRQFRISFTSKTKVDYPSVWSNILSRNFSGIVERKMAELSTPDSAIHLRNSQKFLDEADFLLVSQQIAAAVDSKCGAVS